MSFPEDGRSSPFSVLLLPCLSIVLIDVLSRAHSGKSSTRPPSLKVFWVGLVESQALFWHGQALHFLVQYQQRRYLRWWELCHTQDCYLSIKHCIFWLEVSKYGAYLDESFLISKIAILGTVFAAFGSKNATLNPRLLSWVWENSRQGTKKCNA